MTCKYIAPNGLASKLYDKTVRKYDPIVAESTFILANTPEVKAKYKELNTYEDTKEPTLESMENAGLIKAQAFIDTVVDLDSTKLVKVFSDKGIDVDVIYDLSIEESGKIEYKDGKILVTYNPVKAKKDTKYHEFGHLYIDSLGFKSDIIQQGVEQLRDTPLWNEISTLYPDLSEIALAKEVLTTAIGSEASKLSKNPSWLKRFRFWLNMLFQKIAKALNQDINVAKALAYDLVNQQLRDIVKIKFDNQVQRQKDVKLINDKFITEFGFIQKAKGTISKKIQTYYNTLTEEQKEVNKNYNALVALEEMFTEYAEHDSEEAIIAFVTEAIDQTGKLEDRLESILNPTQEDIDNNKNVITSSIVKQILDYNSTFELLEDVIDLYTRNETLRGRLDIDEVNRTYTRYKMINRNATRIGLQHLGKIMTERGRGRIEALEREALQREYNEQNNEARKAARKSSKTQKAYNHARQSWVDARIRTRARSIYEREGERYIRLLQQAPKDISFMERMFLDADALADDIIQVASEILDEVDFKTMNETVETYKEANKLFEEFHDSRPDALPTKKYDPLIQDAYTVDDKDDLVKGEGKSQYLVSEYLKTYYDKKKELWIGLKEVEEAFGESSVEYEEAKKEVYAWMGDNSVNIGTYEDPIWRPSDRWKDPAYEALMAKDDNDPTKKMYKYLISSIEKADVQLPLWARLTEERDGSNDREGIKFYKLPSIGKRSLTEVVGERGIVGHYSDKLKRFIKGSKEDDTEFGTDLPPSEDSSAATEELTGQEGTNVLQETINRVMEVVTNEAGDESHRVPINFRYDLTSDEQSYDLLSIILLNEHMALNYTNKNEVAADIELMKDMLSTRTIQQVNDSFLRGTKFKLDKLMNNSPDGVSTFPVVGEGIESNSYKAFQSMMELKLYGLGTRSGVSVSRVTDFIASYTGNVLLIGNYLSAGANLLAGNAFNWIAASGGRFFDKRDMLQSISKYSSDITAITNDLGRRVYKSKTNLLMEKFNTLGDWSAVANKFVDDTKFKQLFKTSSLHALNSSAEHMIQNVMMYAILTNTKVKDGNGNFLTKDGTTDDINKALSLDEAYTVEDGKLVLDPRVIDTTAHGVGDLQNNQQAGEFILSRLIRDLNAYIQGQYASDKKSEIQRYWYGTLIMMLRKWMPRGIARRYRGFSNVLLPTKELQEDDKFYSRALGDFQEGYYATTARFAATLFQEAKQLKWELASGQGIRRLQRTAGKTWRDMLDYEQANIKKSVAELSLVIGAFVLAHALKGLGDDAESEPAKKFYFALAFYSLRLQREASTFLNPSELINTLKSPSAALIMVNRGMHLLGQLGIDFYSVLATGELDKYKTGRKRGEAKIWKDIQDLVPLLKNLDRDIEESLSWFMSRRVN